MPFDNIRTDVADWTNRPDITAFDNLPDMKAYVQKLRDNSTAQDVHTSDLRVLANEGKLRLSVEDREIKPNHWAFGSLASMAGAPANYLRDLPPALAAANLQYGLAQADHNIQTYTLDDGEQEPLLRAITSQRYGRIYDADVLDTVMRYAGRGDGTDSRWKIPGVIDWSTGRHEAETKGSSTLVASDRDIFAFLVDDRNPIEVGKTRNGDPDLLFRGFYVWNSEVGSRTFGIATMYLRGVCQNRLLWGVEGFQEATFKHTAGAPERFLNEATPMLDAYAEGAEAKVRAGVSAARTTQIPHKTDEDRIDWFRTRVNLSKTDALGAIRAAEIEEGRKPETIWDAAQGITAHARGRQYDDDRIALEKQAQRLLDKVAA